MDGSRSRRQLVILDCCYSAAFAVGMTLKKDEGKLAIEDLLGGKGRAVLTSSDAIEETQAAEDQDSLSVYTRFLVEGIRTGAADGDGKGWLSPRDLHRYTAQRVCDIAPKMTPQFIHTEDGDSIRVCRVWRDPIDVYRKKVKELVEKQAGVITAAGRAILDSLREEIKLEQEKTELIESEELQLSPEYVVKLGRYRATLLATLEAHGRRPDQLSYQDLEELKELELKLKLRPADVAIINCELISQARLFFQVNQHQLATASPPQAPLTPLELEQPAINEFQRVLNIPTTRGWLEWERKQWVKKQENITVPCYRVDLAERLAITMLRIPSGEFLMGSPEKESGRLYSESPQHLVKLTSFFLSQTPVTQAQWMVVACWPKVNRELNPQPSRFKGANRPVERVSWEDAMEFCRRLSAREKWEYTLPSEEQWEYACRARTTEPFAFGTTLTTDLANYNGKYIYELGSAGTFLQQTTAVESFDANAWGLHDMHGNVWEWCSDTWHDSYQTKNHFGRFLKFDEEGMKVMRGGSWGSDPSRCRSASREKCEAKHGHHYVGFRVCTHSELEMDIERDVDPYSIPVTC